MSNNEDRSNRPATFGWLRSTLYSSGNFSKNILWNTSEVMLLFVFTEMLHLNAAIAGLLLLISLVIDALLDPVIGICAEKNRSRWGQYSPFLMIGSPLAAASFLWLFALPYFQIHDIWLVAFSLFAFRLCYTLIDLPHNAFMAKATVNSRSRSRIAILRFLFSSLASLALAVAIAPMLDSRNDISPGFLLGFAAVAAIVSLIIMYVSLSAVRFTDRVETNTPEEIPKIADIYNSIASNTNFVVVLLIAAAAALSLPLFAKSMLYYSRYVLGDTALASVGLTAMIIGQLSGLPLWMRMATKKENATALGMAHLWLIFACVAFYALSPKSETFFMLLSFMVGVGACGIYSIIWAMIANCVEEGQRVQGVRVEAMLFALATLAQKAAMGLGVWLFGSLLDFSGYAAGQPVAESTIWVIQLVNCGFPVVGSVLCIALLRRYRITHEHHKRVAALYSPSATPRIKHQ